MDEQCPCPTSLQQVPLASRRHEEAEAPLRVTPLEGGVGLQSGPAAPLTQGLLPLPSALSSQPTPEAGEWAAGGVCCMSRPDASLCSPECPRVPRCMLSPVYTVRFLTALSPPLPLTLFAAPALGDVAQGTQGGSPSQWSHRTGGPAPAQTGLGCHSLAPRQPGPRAPLASLLAPVGEGGRRGWEAQVLPLCCSPPALQA